MRIVVTSIGTGEGKTFFARGLVRALARRGARVAALKPFETGVAAAGALDARALERAARSDALAFEHAAFFRAERPLSPLAAVLEGAPAPDVEALQRAFDAFEASHDVAVVESAGGLFVPIAPGREGALPTVFAELARPQDRVILVAENKLGVLSHVVACARALSTSAFEVVLRSASVLDASSSSNAAVLRAMGLTVYELGASRLDANVVDDDDVLADAVESAVPLRWERSQ